MSLFRTRLLILLVSAAVLSACAVQRAQVAHDARSKIIGLTKEQVLACMGPPANRAAEGATEVWSYHSGDGTTTVSTFGSSNTTGTVSRSGGFATGQATTFGSGFGVARQRFCTINVTILNGRVDRLNYLGPTGGLLTAGEQCAYAVEACAH